MTPVRQRPTKTAPSRHAPQGFSLAESLFAMTIVSFVLLAIIGVMPAGLGSLRDADRRALEARICQTMLADFEGRMWVNLATQGTVTTYFDDQGVAVGSPNDPQNRTTKAPNYAVSAMLIADIKNAMVSQGALPNESEVSPYLRYIRMAITSNAQDPEAVTAMRSALLANKPAPNVYLYTFTLVDLEPAKGMQQ